MHIAYFHATPGCGTCRLVHTVIFDFIFIFYYNIIFIVMANILDILSNFGKQRCVSFRSVSVNSVWRNFGGFSKFRKIS